jgi:orotidine-5'-phosphate decarboxylase
MSEHAGDVLVERVDAAGVAACVGLDPDAERMPEGLGDGAEAARSFCCGVIDAVCGLVPAVKPQAACFERFGSAGVAALEAVCGYARERGLVVVLDAKRGDIGVSARHYARSGVDLGAHFMTVNAYLGMETIEPYLEAGLGVFALVRTSNPGSDAVQGVKLASGQTVAEMIGGQLGRLGEGHVGARGMSAVGAVVGATKAEVGSLRALMPNGPMLVPGIGAQGGAIENVRPLCRAGSVGRMGVLVSASRSVLYPGGGGDWQGGVRAAAEGFVEVVKGLG